MFQEYFNIALVQYNLRKECHGGSLQEMKCFTSNFVEGSKPF
jgi:hypothetical protein